MNALEVSQTVLCGHSVGGRVTHLVIVEADPMDPKPAEDRDGYSPSDIETYATFADTLAEAHARKVLGDAAFEVAFAEGQKKSLLDEGLDLALKTVEEM